jgi:hypothetical protein
LWKLWLRRMIWGMLWLGVIVLLWRRSLVDEIGQGRWRVGVEIGSWRMMNQFWSRSWWNHNRRWTKIGSMNTRGTGSKRTIGRDMGPSRGDSRTKIPCSRVDTVPTRHCSSQTGRRSSYGCRRW